MLMYDAVEIKLIVVVFKFHSHALRPHKGVQGKRYILMGLSIYGKQIEPSPIFTALDS